MRRDRTRFMAVFLLSLLALAPRPALSAPKDRAAAKAVEAAVPPAAAPAAKPAPYDNRLSRFAEILGSIHYLRGLCDPAKADEWRVGMQSLLDVETRDEPARREVLTAAFNRGYRSFASVYTRCTQAAIAAEERYRNEGATLAAEISARFGN